MQQRVLVQVQPELYTGASNSLSLSFLGAVVEQISTLLSSGAKIVFLEGKLDQAIENAYRQLLALLGVSVVCSVVDDTAAISWPEGRAISLLATSDSKDVYATAAELAAHLRPDLLIFLGAASGVMDHGKLVKHVSPATEAAAQPPAVQAASQAGLKVASGSCRVVIASGTERNILVRLAAGEEVGSSLHAAALPADGGASAPTSSTRSMAVRARGASRKLQTLASKEREDMLNRIADALLAHEAEIMAENAADVAEAQGKISDALLQRLILKPQKVAQLAAGIRAIAAMDEPLGSVLRRMELAEGLVLTKVTSAIGVLLIIFEARPDALPQIAALALRSGNGLLLKGGKEASRSNAILHRCIVDAIGPLGPDLISLVTSREEIKELLALDDCIDLAIPRGGNELVSYVQRNTKIPVLGHADGICHIYVDAAADMDMAVSLVVDAKTDYPAACNAVEKVLVHQSLVPSGGLKQIADALQAAGVALHGGRALRTAGLMDLLPAPSERHEYSAMAVTLEVVGSLQEAVDHIHAHGSGHTDCIITQDQEAASAFIRMVDSACVFHNASTRFADGFRFGLGAEVGISTSRIHARGPVGVEGLLTTRWLLQGHGQKVAKDTGVQYTHKLLPSC